MAETTKNKIEGNEELMKQRYMQFQMLQQQIEQINGHLEMLNQQGMELEISIGAIKEVSKTPINNELLTPIADGIFLKTELKDNKKFVVNVGFNVTVEKSADEIVKLLEDQKKETVERISEAEMVLQELGQQAMKIYQEVENISPE